MPKAGESIAPMPGIDLPQRLPTHKKQTKTRQYVFKKGQKHISYGKTQHFRCFITIYRENIISLQAENNLQNQKNAPKAISTMMIPRQGNTRSYLRYLARKQTAKDIYNMYVHI